MVLFRLLKAKLSPIFIEIKTFHQNRSKELLMRAIAPMDSINLKSNFCRSCRGSCIIHSTLHGEASLSWEEYNRNNLFFLQLSVSNEKFKKLKENQKDTALYFNEGEVRGVTRAVKVGGMDEIS